MRTQPLGSRPLSWFTHRLLYEVTVGQFEGEQELSRVVATGLLEARLWLTAVNAWRTANGFQGRLQLRRWDAHCRMSAAVLHEGPDLGPCRDHDQGALERLQCSKGPHAPKRLPSLVGALSWERDGDTQIFRNTSLLRRKATLSLRMLKCLS